MNSTIKFEDRTLKKVLPENNQELNINTLDMKEEGNFAEFNLYLKEF